MSNNIFPIQARYAQLTAILEDAGGELSDEMQAAVEFTESEFEEAAQQVGLAILENDLDIDKLDKAIERLSQMRGKYQQRNAALRERLKGGMLQFGFTKLKGDYMTLSITPSKAVVFTDEAAIPAQYRTVVTTEKISKKEIGDAIKAGQSVPGAELIENKNLRIS